MFEGRITITNGTVLDRLPAWQGARILQALWSDRPLPKLALLVGLGSGQAGQKDLAILDEWTLTSRDEERLALLAPGVTIARVVDGSPREKFSPRLPLVLERLILCPNSHCITRSEEVPSKIVPLERAELGLCCHYCNHRFSLQEVELL